MLTYKEHFSSSRPDGRHVSTMAAYMESLRHLKPELSLPEDLTAETFALWKEKVISKYMELLQMPEFTAQPDPVLLNSVQRDGYRVEKWEFYPDDYTAVPFLMLIPDQACAGNPVPGVMCLLGSHWSKEFAAGEELIDHPNCLFNEMPERNQMAKEFAQAGMVSVVFDNLEVGECSLHDLPEKGQTLWRTRVELCHGLLHGGYNYLGLTVFQKLCAWKFLRKLDYIDHDRWAIASHSLGSEPALILGVLLDEVKAIIYNNFLVDDRRRYVAITEEEVDEMHQDVGNWHIVPGIMRYFAFQDMCAALAPKYLALTEGGAEEFLEEVERAYRAAGVPDHLSITHYPAYSDPESRTAHGKVPLHGLTRSEFYRHWSYCLPEDHSFRMKPAMKHILKAFENK